MGKSIKRQVLASRSDFWQVPAFLGGAWLVGMGINVGIQIAAPQDAMFIVGVIATGMAYVILELIVPAYNFSVGMEQAVSLGCTRRGSIIGLLCATLLQMASSFVVACLLAAAEFGIGRWALGERYSAGKLEGLTEELWPLLGVCGGVMLGLLCLAVFCGACMQRWGRKAFIVLWGLCVLASLFGSSFHTVSQADSLLGRFLRGLGGAFAGVPPQVWNVLVTAALPALAAFGIWLLLNSSVQTAK